MIFKFFLTLFIFSIFTLNTIIADDESDLKEKIDSVVLKTVNFENLSLQRTITKLQELSKTNDPDKRGILMLQKLTPEDKKKIINLEVSDMPLRDAIEYISQSSGISHSIEGKYLIFASEAPANGPKKTADDKNSKNTKNNQKEMILNEKFLKSLVTVEGKKGSGSGFIVNFNGKKTLITNIHVIFNNTEISFRDINNNKVPVTNMYLSSERDIFMADVDESFDIAALEMETDVSTVKMGGKVAVFGNSQGSGVNTEVQGKLLGAGGRTIELDAPFVAGNSGSPIIFMETGKVIGVATYVTYKSADWSDFDSSFVYKPRRFAQRIDNITKTELQPMDMMKYQEDIKKYNSLIDSCIIGYNLYKDIPSFLNSYSDGRFSPVNALKYKDFPAVYKILNEMNKNSASDSSSSLAGVDTFAATTRQISGRTEPRVAISNARNSITSLKVLFKNSLNNYKRVPMNYKFIAQEAEKYSKILEFIVKEYDKYNEYLNNINQSAKASSKSTKKL